MKALSLHGANAMYIAMGLKEYEYRSWPTDYRGDLLICSTKGNSGNGTIPAHAICVVELVDCQKLEEYSYAWKLENIRIIEPVHVRGQMKLFDVEIDPHYCPDDLSEDEQIKWENKYFSPYIKGAKQDKNGNWKIPFPELD